MKPSSAKSKGRNLQKAVVELILNSYPELNQRDVQSTPMGANGADVKLSSVAFSALPFAIECKNIATFHGYSFMDQAEEHSRREGGIPVAVVKANSRDPLVIMSLEDLLSLLTAAEAALEE